MNIMSFDLSSKCIGVLAASINGVTGEINFMRSCPIIPPKFKPDTLGYKNSKKKLPTKKEGVLINTYWKDGEESITKVEKKRRDTEVRNAKNMFVLRYISKQMDKLIDKVKPDLILVERNETFNGILTTELLAKVMGTLVSITGIRDIDLIEENVSVVRGVFDIPELLKKAREVYSQEELMSMDDLTKRVIRDKLSEIYGEYGVKFSTDDESDACAVFHHWRNKTFNL